MSTYAVQPGARLLWSLRRRQTDVRCVLYPNTVPVEVQIVQERDVVVRNNFVEEWMAVKWAAAYEEGLRRRGYKDSPDPAV